MFQRAVDEHRGERHSRGFRCWDQFVAMLFCQLGQARSLREIEEGLRASEGKPRHLNMQEAPAHSTLAYANQHRPWQVYETLFTQLSASLTGQLTQAERAPRLKLPHRQLRLDSTVVDLCAKVFDWAKYRKARSRVDVPMRRHGAIAGGADFQGPGGHGREQVRGDAHGAGAGVAAVAERAEEDEGVLFGRAHEEEEARHLPVLVHGGEQDSLEVEAAGMRTNDSIDAHDPVTLSELPEGLQVEQGGRMYVARNWRLSPGLLRLMACAFEHGLACLIRERHPLPEKPDAEHIGFSRSPKDDWVFVVDQFSCT